MPGYFFFFGAYEITRMLLTPAGASRDDLSRCKVYHEVTFTLLSFETNIAVAGVSVMVNLALIILQGITSSHHTRSTLP